MARLMKDSGIQWIGDIPQHWNVIRNKNIFKEIIEHSNNNDNYDLLSVSEYYGVAKKRDTISDNDFLTRAESLEGYKICYPNDIVMNIMLAWKSSLGVSQYKGIVSPAYCVYRSLININVKYYHYLFRTDKYAHLFKQYSTGIINSRLRLYPEKFLSLYSHFPPIEEQGRIANYLDEKCSKIDETIEKEKAIIEKLKEYKQSLITETVTKGLNPNVPLKDSGIDWIGSIPQHWEMIKLKKILSYPLQYGANASGEIYGDKKPRYIRITDITMDNKLKEEGKLSLNFNDAEPYILQDGDILFARSGATVGKTFIYYKEYGLCAFAGYLIKATLSCKMIPKFLYYYTLSNSYEQWKNQIFIQATIQNIGADKYSNMQLTFPPIEEQEEISEYLDEKCNVIDNAITQRETLIDKLIEYKKSLIYECVTGKREV